MAGTSPAVGFGDDWFKSVADLEGADGKRVNRALHHFVNDPDHPGLNLHPVAGDSAARLHTIRASQELRILLAKEGNVYVFLEAGHHDDIYERARRCRFVVNPHRGYVGLVDVVGVADLSDGAQTPTERRVPSKGDDRPGLFDHWSDADLRDAGMSDDEIEKVRACRTEDELCEQVLDDETLELLIELLELTPEQWRTPPIDPSAEAEARIRDAIGRFGALAGISRLFTTEEVEQIAAAPVEEWMIFLHPEQQALVDRRFEGPARVRGSAGTGKTVVALHRAAALARRLAEAGDTRPVLFTTYIKSLPPVFEALYGRLPAAAGGVEFVNVDKLAFKVCREAGDKPAVNPKNVDAAFAAACRSVVTDESQLGQLGLTREYLRQEVIAVIKGRGLTTIDEYLAVERTGRRTPFGEAVRREVWTLYLAWQVEMAKRGTVDFPDVVFLARDHARRSRDASYAAAIVDEAQDLTLVGLDLVRALVNAPGEVDRPDGLFIVGDGAQRIYPGGFTLRQAGVEVRGRTAVLRQNYRNTQAIIDAAMAVAGDEPVDDLGEAHARGDAPSEALRDGARPALVLCSGHDDELRFLVDEIVRLHDVAGIGLGDIAVATATNDQARRVFAALKAGGITTQDLTKYEGVPTEMVKVGTHFRIKGLEFKVVLLPFMGAADFPRPPSAGQLPSEYDEQRARSISQLFVAMTRARDGLFLLASGDPSSVVEPAMDHFELIET